MVSTELTVHVDIRSSQEEMANVPITVARFYPSWRILVRLMRHLEAGRCALSLRMPHYLLVSSLSSGSSLLYICQKKLTAPRGIPGMLLSLGLYPLWLSFSLCSGVYTFLSSTLKSLEEKDHIHRVLDKITDTLIHLMAKAGLTLQQQHRRLAQLLLILSHIRHMRWGSSGYHWRDKKMLIQPTVWHLTQGGLLTK